MDLRVPSGWFFLLTGVILILNGFMSPKAPLLDVNVNLYSGSTMAVFGAIMLWLSRKQPL